MAQIRQLLWLVKASPAPRCNQRRVSYAGALSWNCLGPIYSGAAMPEKSRISPSDASAHASGAADAPTPQQTAAIKTKHVSIVLSAGAGCGKTSVLTQRFLSHLEQGEHRAELSSLVAITFTERAAREMRDRIRSKCREKLQSCPAEEVSHWQAILRELDSARISTIHSFCSSLLRSNAVEVGIDPRFTLLDETLGSSFLKKSVETGLHRLLARNDADAAELVFEFGLSRARVIIAALIPQRYRISVPEWQARTAKDLAALWDQRWHGEVVPQLLSEIAESPAAARTLELLRDYIPQSAVMQERRLALLALLPTLAGSPDPESALEALQDNARVQGGGTKKDWPNEDVYGEIRDALKNLRDQAEKTLGLLDYDPEHLLRGAEIALCALRAAASLGESYDSEKKEAGLVDFDDLLLRARDLLRDHADVRRRAAKGTSLLMVDEFQDTDPIQDDIVRLLCPDAFVEGRLFVVGDSKQSIYRFRRAEPRVFHKLRRDVGAEGRLPLSFNFRSQPQILSFINALFDGALGSEYEALETTAEQLSPSPCVEFLF